MKFNLCVLCLCLSVLNIVFAKIEYATQRYEKPKRVTPHVPKIIDKTCRLKPDRGPCRGNIKMYYFDPVAMKCDDFIWGGCQGNGNRFDEETECKTTCLSQSGQRLPRPKYCELTFDYGYCFGADERYYYDKIWKVCKKGIYSGCGGNKNNFYSLENCESICRFNAGRVPRSRPKKGDGLKKYLVINPGHATSKRGVDQGRGSKGAKSLRSGKLGLPDESDRPGGSGELGKTSKSGDAGKSTRSGE